MISTTKKRKYSSFGLDVKQCSGSVVDRFVSFEDELSSPQSAINIWTLSYGPPSFSPHTSSKITQSGNFKKQRTDRDSLSERVRDQLNEEFVSYFKHPSKNKEEDEERNISQNQEIEQGKEEMKLEKMEEEEESSSSSYIQLLEAMKEEKKRFEDLQRNIVKTIVKK